MSNVHTLIVALLLLPAVVAAWFTWREVREVEIELSEFEGFQGMHFDHAH